MISNNVLKSVLKSDHWMCYSSLLAFLRKGNRPFHLVVRRALDYILLHRVNALLALTSFRKMFDLFSMRIGKCLNKVVIIEWKHTSMRRLDNDPAATFLLVSIQSYFSKCQNIWMIKLEEIWEWAQRWLSIDVPIATRPHKPQRNPFVLSIFILLGGFGRIW